MAAANVEKLIHVANSCREERSQHELGVVGDNVMRR